MTMLNGSCICGTSRFRASGPAASHFSQFWKGADDPDTGMAPGALDRPTGLRLVRHIFTADTGDYYDIKDNVPQEEQET